MSVEALENSIKRVQEIKNPLFLKIKNYQIVEHQPCNEWEQSKIVIQQILEPFDYTLAQLKEV